MQSERPSALDRTPVAMIAAEMLQLGAILQLSIHRMEWLQRGLDVWSSYDGHVVHACASVALERPLLVVYAQLSLSLLLLLLLFGGLARVLAQHVFVPALELGRTKLALLLLVVLVPSAERSDCEDPRRNAAVHSSTHAETHMRSDGCIQLVRTLGRLDRV